MSTGKTIIAIDPGCNGGLAILENGKPYAHKMPDTDTELLEMLQNIKHRAIAEGRDCEAVVEKVGGYIAGVRAPGSAMFNFGDGCGFLRGALMALGYRIIYTRPQDWTKSLSLGIRGLRSKTAWKQRLRDEAQRRFPHLKVTLKIADALLILEAHLKNGGRVE